MPKFRTIYPDNISPGLCACGCGLLFTPTKHHPTGRFISGHNSRVRRHRLSLEERLTARTIKTATCWIWTGPTSGQMGYGTLHVNGKRDYIHRHVYVALHGDIPDGYYVCHTCDTPRCWRPDHLFLGTAQENVLDCIAKERHVTFTKPHTLSHAGENNPGATFTDAEVLKIRGMYLTMSARQIAQEVKRNYATIKKIVQRRSWKHLP